MRKLEIDGWNLVRNDQAGREHWLIADRQGEIHGRIEFERGRAVGYVEGGTEPVIDATIATAKGAKSRPDGFGPADDASREAILTLVMQMLPAYLPL